MGTVFAIFACGWLVKEENTSCAYDWILLPNNKIDGNHIGQWLNPNEIITMHCEIRMFDKFELLRKSYTLFFVCRFCTVVSLTILSLHCFQLSAASLPQVSSVTVKTRAPQNELVTVWYRIPINYHPRQTREPIDQQRAEVSVHGELPYHSSMAGWFMPGND